MVSLTWRKCQELERLQRELEMHILLKRGCVFQSILGEGRGRGEEFGFAVIV